MDGVVLVALVFGHTVFVALTVGQSQFYGFYQENWNLSPDNETDHLNVMEELNKSVRRMLGALEHQTKEQINKLSLEAITVGQNVLHSAELRYKKYARPERYNQYMSPEDYEKFILFQKDTRYCLEKIDSIFQRLPGVLM